MVLVDLWTRRQKEQQKIRLLKEQLEIEIGKNTAASLKTQYKTLFPSALQKMNRVIVDEDDPNDPWLVQENPLLVELTYEIEYELDTQDPWIVSDNRLLEEQEDDDDWIIIPNLLAIDDKGESVYAGMSTRLIRIEFDLPFYATDEEDSDEDTSRNVNDIIESLFTKQRAKKRILSIKKSVSGFAKKMKKSKE